MCKKLDTTDTLKLNEALRLIEEVHKSNIDNSHRTRRLRVLLCKLTVWLDNFGDKETLENGPVNS